MNPLDQIAVFNSEATHARFNAFPKAKIVISIINH